MTKYNPTLFLALAVSLFSCSKNDGTLSSVHIQGIAINGREDFPANIAVGQTLVLSPVLNDSLSLNSYSWTISPDHDSEFGNRSERQITWRPQEVSAYTIKVTVFNTVTRTIDSASVSFNTQKADFRYELWGSNYDNIALNENANPSDLLYEDPSGYYVTYRVTDKGAWNGKSTDQSQTGDYATYIFTDGKLSGGMVTIPLDFGSDGDKYLNEFFFKIEERLGEYDYLYEEHEWGTDGAAQAYKNDPQLLATAFEKGYVVLKEYYENATSNIVYFMERTDEGATVTIEYSAKK